MMEIAARLIRCLSNIEIQSYYGRIKVMSIYPCGLRFICPMCHYFWAKKHAKKKGRKLTRLTGEGYKPYLLTLTITSTPIITRAFLDGLWDRWKRLRSHPLFDDCICTVAAMEIRIGANGWQIHFHIILAAKSMIPVEPVRVEWHELTKDFALGYQVNIKPVEVATIERLIHYALKYPKIENSKDLRTLHETIKGYRLVRSTGRTT